MYLFLEKKTDYNLLQLTTNMNKPNYNLDSICRTYSASYNSLVALNVISGQRSSVNCRLTRLVAR